MTEKDLEEFMKEFRNKKPKATHKELDKFNECSAILEQLRTANLEKEPYDRTEYAKYYNLQMALIRNYDWDDEEIEVDDKVGMKDFLGNVILEPVWDEILMRLDYHAHKDNPFAVKRDGLWGLVSADGTNTIVCEPQYDYLLFTLGSRSGLSEKNQDFYIVKKNGKYGLLLPDGKEHVPCIMDKIRYEFQTLAIFNKGKIGFIASNLSHTVVMPEYDYIDFGTDDFLMLTARKGDQWGRINSSSGDFELSYVEKVPDAVETVEVDDIKLSVCLEEDPGSDKPIEKRIKFRYDGCWQNLIELKNGRYKTAEFFEYVDRLINTRVKTSLSEQPIPLCGNVIPNSLDLSKEKEMPVSSPLFHNSLEGWFFWEKFREFCQKMYDRSNIKTKEHHRLPHRDAEKKNSFFCKDSAKSMGSDSTPYIKDGKWGFKAWKDTGAIYEEFRGIYPGRIRAREGNEWKDLDSRGVGQSLDASFLHGYLEICDFLDQLAGNKNGHYIAANIEKLCQGSVSASYTQPTYNIVETTDINGLRIDKIKTDFLPAGSDEREYTYMLKKPLVEVLKEKMTLDLNIPDNITLQPYYSDFVLFHSINRGECNGNLANELQVLFSGKYRMNDRVFERDGKIGVCDCFGHIVLDAEYDDADPIEDENFIPRGAIVQIGDKFSFVLRSMPKPSDDNWYDDVEMCFSTESTCFFCKRAGKIGVIDVFGNIVVPCEMDDIEEFTDKVALIKKGNNIGFIIDTQDFFRGFNGLIYVAPEYQDWKGAEEMSVLKDGTWGYIDDNGKYTTDIYERGDFWYDSEDLDNEEDYLDDKFETEFDINNE